MKLLLIEQLFLLEPGQHCGLGIRADIGDNRFVKSSGAAGAQSMPKALVQFPDRIPDPGELKRTERLRLRKRGLTTDPVAQAAN